MENVPYEVFIQGETIDLALPSERAIESDGWHLWLNDPDVNKYTGHGQIPNTIEKQRTFLTDLLRPESDRFALLIIPKGDDRAIGVVSLSSINREHRRAETAMIIGSRNRQGSAIFHGLEAKARIVEHAFEKIGLERISGYQIKDLAEWQRFQVLFGFRPEGLLRQYQRAGRRSCDTVVTACTIEDYEKVLAERGCYWPGKARLLELMRTVPKRSIVGDVEAAIESAVAAYLSDTPMK